MSVTGTLPELPNRLLNIIYIHVSLNFHLMFVHVEASYIHVYYIVGNFKPGVIFGRLVILIVSWI